MEFAEAYGPPMMAPIMMAPPGMPPHYAAYALPPAAYYHNRGGA